MPRIKIFTNIKARIEICFDLSRSIDFHQISTSKTRECAVEGKTHGLIELGETVTWEAYHFFLKQRLTSKITALDFPNHFQDIQISGAFESFTHDHYFSQKGEFVEMIDVFDFEAPFGLLGKIVGWLLLKPYLTRFLKTRNALVKEYAESEKWKVVLS